MDVKAGLYSMPAFLKASGEAKVTFRLANSSGVISGMAIPAANGSPKDEREVKGPKAKACAFKCAALNKTPKAAVMAVVRHDTCGKVVMVCDVGLDLICIFAVNFVLSVMGRLDSCHKFQLVSIA
ncbi:MAG: hypothetical protein Q7T07_07660 [Burkholderiaceae bacterium]|nr:hypothetical protein [Burkholderiaceae bacterium]